MALVTHEGKKLRTSENFDLAPVMVACFVLGLARTGEIEDDDPSVPGMSDLGNWNIVVGMGLFVVGFVFSTQWR